MAKNEYHLGKKGKVGKSLTRQTKIKDLVEDSRLSTGKCSVFKGGVVQVQIHRTRMVDGEYGIKFKKVSPMTKNSYGLFVAGGSEVDRIVASANASLSLPKSRSVIRKRGLSALSNFFLHKIVR
jgi:hypothetical protein